MLAIGSWILYSTAMSWITFIILVLLMWAAFYWYYSRKQARWINLLSAIKDLSLGNMNISVPRPDSKIHLEAAGYVDEIKGQLIRLRNQCSVEVSNLRGILDSMTEGVMVVDSFGKIRLANEQLVRLFGLGNDPKGQSLMEALRNHAIYDVFQKASKVGKVLGEEITMGHGQELFFELNALKLQGEGDQFKGVVFVFHDITKIRRLENVRKEFVTNASHELRTPLSIIKGYVETLADGAIDEPKTARKFIGIMQKHTERLAVLIEDMLELSRIESGRLDIRLEMVKVQPILLRVIQSFHSLTDRKKINIFSKANPGNIEWKVDSNLIERVIFNLVDNAIKYSPDGGEIRIETTVNDRDFLFSISDNGPGIPKESMEHLFERFYRVDKSRSNDSGGTGLGLSIAKHIIENHKGRIWVESTYGKGAAFSFTIPRS